MKKTIKLMAIIMTIMAFSKLSAQCTALPGSNKTICCAGGTVSLGDGGTSATSSCPCGFFTYDWLPAASLSSNTVANPIASPTTTTIYTLCVTAYGVHGNCNTICCTDCETVQVTVNTSCCRLMAPGSGGISEPKSPRHVDVTVYPNPAKSVINIDVNESLVNAELNIFDINGRSVWKKQKITDKQTLNVDASLFPKGVYFIKIFEGETQIYSYKVLLE